MRAVLGVPLFYKLLIANSVIVIAGAVAGSALTAEFVRAAPERSTIELVGWLAALGVLVSVAVNALILRWALAPVWQLEETANAASSGELDARATISPLADRDFRRLTETFNAMLDRGRDHRRRLRDLAAEATRAAESERKRIARELHDDTAQSLAALLVRLRLLDVDERDDRRARIQELRDQLAGTLEQVRRTAHALRPETLEDLGLEAAIEHHARALAHERDLQLDLVPPPADLPITPEAELSLYRIIQEAMTNAARHSGASTLRVRAWREGDRLVTTIQDDGHGFDVEQAMQRRGRLGLFGMKERASHFGGRVDIRSTPGQGTTVRVSLPVPLEADA